MRAEHSLTVAVLVEQTVINGSTMFGVTTQLLTAGLSCHALATFQLLARDMQQHWWTT